MLQSIRDNTQGWIAGVIVSLLILSFALWGIHSYIGGGGATDVVAKVNGTEITKTQLSVAYERLRRQLQMQSNSMAGLPEGAESALKSRALQALVNIQVLKQASIEQNYRISENQVDSLLESMPEFQTNGQFSLARFQQVLSTTLFNAGEFLDLLKTSLLIDQPRLGLLLSSFAMPNEVLNALALVNQERNIRYAIISTRDLMNQAIAIPADQVEAYYKAHQDEFKNAEQVSVQYIELSLNDLLSSIHPSEDELKKFYTENSSSYAEPMQWKLEAILIPVAENATDKDILNAQNKMTDIMQRVGKKENFSTFAHQYPAGKLAEKLQGWVTINRLPQELQKTVMALTKTGQVSALAKTESGFVLLKATDIKQAKTQSYEQVKEKVKESFVRQQAEEKFANLKEKLTNSTYEHPDSLEPAAQTMGLTVKSTGLFTKEKGSNDITKDAKFREAAFNNDVLNLRNNSDVIQPTPDTAIVLRVNSHTAATVLPLKSVETQIIDKLKLQQVEQLTQKRADEIKNKLTAGQDVSLFNLSWTDAGYIGRHATKVDTAILNEAFAMPKPDNKASKPVYSVVKVANGYAVIALNAVKDGEAHNKREEYDLFAEQIQNSQGLLEYELYKDSIMKRSDITIENQQDTTTSLASQ